MSLETVLAAFQDGLRPAGSGKWKTRCSSHDDREPSVEITCGADGRVLIYCHAGCELDCILDAAGLEMADLFEAPAPGIPAKPRIVAEYSYRDEKGEELYQAVRFEPKTFRQRRKTHGEWSWSLEGVRRVLYRLPELIASPAASYCFICEGEKDVDNLTKLGLVATCNVGGAGKWKPEYSNFLRGRRVAIIPDNDAPGAKHAADVAEKLQGVAFAVTTLFLGGPKDVSDWLEAGGTKEQLLAMAEKALPPMPEGFRSAVEVISGERAERYAQADRILPFGVQFLDDCLGGIMPEDLVLLGAKSGIGKTSLATSISRHAARNGRKVHYFAIEAEKREIERRIKYRIIAELYYQSDRRHEDAPPICYLDWRQGRNRALFEALEDRAAAAMPAAMANLHTFYKAVSFTVADFVREYESVAKETDLVILDHLHLIDFDERDENRGFKEAMKRVRDAVVRVEKPVILIAHVRKSDRKFPELLPGLEDFHGSSEIGKICTQAIVLGPGTPDGPKHMWPTYMQAPKSRHEGSRTRYIAKLDFDSRLNEYRKDYDIGKLEGGEWTPLSLEQTPEWARKGSQKAREARLQQGGDDGV